MPAAPAGRVPLPTARRDRSPLRQYPPWLHARRWRPARLDAPARRPAPRGRWRPRARSTTPPTGRSPTACRTRWTRTGAAACTGRSARCSTRRCCSRTPRRRWRATPARPGATTARGRSWTQLCNGPAWVKSPSTGTQGHMPGWRDGLTGGGIQHLVVDTEIVWALLRSRGARGRRSASDGGPDRRPHHLHHRGRVLALAGAAAQPGQLVRAHVHGGRGGRRDQGEPARPAAQAAAPLRGRRAQADGGRRDREPRARPTASTTCRAPTTTTSSTSTAPSTRTSSAACSSPTSRRATPGCRRWTRPARRSSAAWCERVLCGLLDARRLPELGHRPRLQALAPGQEARALAGRAARHGGVRRARAERRRGPSTCSTARSSSSTAGPSAAGACRQRTPSACRRSTTTSPRRCSPPRGCRPTPPRPRSSGSAPSAPRSRRRCTRTTPTSAGSPSPRPPTTRRSSPSTAAPSRTAASSWPGCSTASRTSRAASAGARRRPSGVVVRNSSGTIVAASQRTLRQRLAAAAAVADRTRVRPYAGAFSTLRARGKTSRSGIDITTTHTFRATYIETAWHVDGASGKSVEVLFPSWGKGARVWAVSASGERTALQQVALARRDRVVPRRERALRLRGRDPQRRHERDRAHPGRRRAVVRARSRTDLGRAREGAVP